MRLSCRIKERLHVKLVESGSAVVSRPMDWRALGVPEWLADRAERLGFLFPTGVQSWMDMREAWRCMPVPG